MNTNTTPKSTNASPMSTKDATKNTKDTPKSTNTTPKKWELWAKEKKPSMKRRCEGHNYYDRGIYMITMATEGRKPLLGTLTGNPDITEGEQAPRVVLSPLGKKIQECWASIPKYYRQIEPLKLCIMPDHIHGILFVHERMEKHLGHAIEGFKTGTRKAARELGLLPPAAPATVPSTAPVTVPSTAPMAQYTKQQERQQQERQQQEKQQQERQQQEKQLQATQQARQQHPSRHTAVGRSHGMLWEPGFNDRILSGKGQLERMFAYLNDNPRRLLIKRMHPEFFTQRHHFVFNGISFEGIGNRLLLDSPMKIQVQCSRKMTADAIAYQQATTLEKGREGFVIVSPCISPGEQQIATSAMKAGMPLIVLLLNGLHPYFKPQPRYFEACQKGLLLILSPFPWQNEKIENMRQRCLQLNAIAAAIVQQF